MLNLDSSTLITHGIGQKGLTIRVKEHGKGTAQFFFLLKINVRESEANDSMSVLTGLCLLTCNGQFR